MDRRHIDDHHIVARYLADQLTDAERMSFFEGYGTGPLDKSTRRWFEDLYEFF